MSLELTTMLSDGARTFGGNDRKDVAVSVIVLSTCRRVAKWVLRGVRVGEAANPGSASKRRHTQRLRALQRSMDSDSADDRPLVSTSGPEVFAMSDREDSMVDDPTTGVEPTTLHSCWWKAIGVAPTVIWRHPAIRVRQILCR